MSWIFDSNRPIYTQLIEQMKLSIISQVYPAASKLPSVRDLAAQAGVNPNTMQKALSELEREGLVYTQRTAGRFITEDAQKVAKLKESLVSNEITNFFQKMQTMGFTNQEVLDAIHSTIKEELSL